MPGAPSGCTSPCVHQAIVKKFCKFLHKYLEIRLFIFIFAPEIKKLLTYNSIVKVVEKVGATPPVNYFCFNKFLVSNRGQL